MKSFIIIFSFLAFALVLDHILEKIKEGRLKENLDKLNKKIDEIGVDGGTIFRYMDDIGAAILDHDNEKLYVVDFIQRNPSKFEFEYETIECDFKDILEAKLIVDGETLTHTSRGSQIGGALVGGALMGGVGAVIGGLSGKTTSKDLVRSIDIRLTVNNIKRPIITVRFLHGITYGLPDRSTFKGVEKNSHAYNYAFNEAEKWNGLFKIILQDKK